MSIFKSYDIRGLSPQELSKEKAVKIGAATVRYLNAKKLIVGRDMRLTSPMLLDAFIYGANSEGCSCIDVGLCTTPLTYWAVEKYKADGSIMITGSHNPAQYNGFKICAAGPVSLSYDHGLKYIEKIVDDIIINEFHHFSGNKTIDPWFEYKQHLMSFKTEWKPFRVVIDAGNGMGGLAIKKVFNDFPGIIHEMYFEPDGSFPNHEANPLKYECLEDLIKEVKRTRADFGVSFDGDADRFTLIDEKGEVVPCDLLTAFFAESFLQFHKGAGVIYDLRSSHIVPETIQKNGGVSHRERVGHSHIKRTLRETGSIFGGELSGHFYFRDHMNSDSALFALIMILNFLSESNKLLSELINPYRVYCHSGEINFEIEDKDEVIKKIEEKYDGVGVADYLDGLTMQFDGWWFNLRKSNTESILRLNLEAENNKICQEKIIEITNFLKK